MGSRPPRVLRTVIVTTIAGFAFLVVLMLNDDWVRARFAAPFEFGKREMLGVLQTLNRQRSWDLVVTARHYAVELQLRPQPGVDRIEKMAWRPEPLRRRARACGHRTFFESAAACSESTELRVQGTLALRDLGATPPALVAQGIAVSGALIASGKELGPVAVALRGEEATVLLSSDDARLFEVARLRLPRIQLAFERAKP